MRTRLTRLLASAAVFGGVLAAGGLTASASESEGGQGGEAIDMRMHIAVDRFAAKDGKAYATGPVTLRTEQSDGTEETTVEYASFRVQRGTGGGGDGDKTCKILRLHLSASFVALLGLEVTTSDINVEITGHSRRALGKLFCKLSEGLKLDRAQLTRKTVRSLNRRLDGDQLNIVRFNARLHPRRSPPRRQRPLHAPRVMEAPAVRSSISTWARSSWTCSASLWISTARLLRARSISTRMPTRTAAPSAQRCVRFRAVPQTRPPSHRRIWTLNLRSA